MLHKVWLWLKGHWMYLVGLVLVIGAYLLGRRRAVSGLVNLFNRGTVDDAALRLGEAGERADDIADTAGELSGAITEGGAALAEASATGERLADGHHRLTDIVQELARRYGVNPD